MNLGGAARNERDGQASVEIVAENKPIVLRSLKGESTFSSSTNLAVSR